MNMSNHPALVGEPTPFGGSTLRAQRRSCRHAAEQVSTCAEHRRHRLGIRLRDERGMALVMALGIMLVLTITLTTVITFTAAGSRDSHRVNAGQKATALAEAGVNNALAVLTQNYPAPSSIPATRACCRRGRRRIHSGSVTLVRNAARGRPGDGLVEATSGGSHRRNGAEPDGPRRCADHADCDGDRADRDPGDRRRSTRRAAR